MMNSVRGKQTLEGDEMRIPAPPPLSQTPPNPHSHSHKPTHTPYPHTPLLVRDPTLGFPRGIVFNCPTGSRLLGRPTLVLTTTR